MSTVTVITPTLFTKGFWTLKEPFNSYVTNNYNVDLANSRQTLISIMSMKDLIANNMIDPFTAIYEPAGLTEVDFKEDLLDDIPVLSFSAAVGSTDALYRVPLSYVQSVPADDDVVYRNKAIVLDLGDLPEGVDLSIHNTDMSEFALSKYGVVPTVKEVEVGPAIYVSHTQSSLRETVRKNSATQRDTHLLQLRKLQSLFDETMYKYAKVSDCFVQAKTLAADLMAILNGKNAATGLSISLSSTNIVKGSSFVTKVTGNLPDGSTFAWATYKPGGSTSLMKPFGGTITIYNGLAYIYHYVQSKATISDSVFYIVLKNGILDFDFAAISEGIATKEHKLGTESYVVTVNLEQLPISGMAQGIAATPSFRSSLELFYA